MTAGLVLAAAGLVVAVAAGTLDRENAADVLSMGGLVFAFVGALVLFETPLSTPGVSLAEYAVAGGRSALYALATGGLMLAGGLLLDETTDGGG